MLSEWRCKLLGMDVPALTTVTGVTEGVVDAAIKQLEAKIADRDGSEQRARSPALGMDVVRSGAEQTVMASPRGNVITELRYSSSQETMAPGCAEGDRAPQHLAASREDALPGMGIGGRSCE